MTKKTLLSFITPGVLSSIRSRISLTPFSHNSVWPLQSRHICSTPSHPHLHSTPVASSQPGEVNAPSDGCKISTKSFEIINQKVLFKRYQTVYQRDVRYPDGRQVSYDVLGNVKSDFKSVFIFPYNTRTRTVTVLREYSPGRNTEQLSLVAGMFEPSKHDSIEMAARAELSEEAHLKHGQLILLSSPIQADKYSLNQYFYFLVLDPVPDFQPLSRDPEEWITILEPIPVTQIKSLIETGQFNTPSSLCALLALDKLRLLNHPISLNT